MDKAFVKLDTQLKVPSIENEANQQPLTYPLASSPIRGFHTLEGDIDGRTNAQTFLFFICKEI
jgi:hypothetical protein